MGRTVKPDELRRLVDRYRERVGEAKRTLDEELRLSMPAIVTREIDKLRKREGDALKLLIVAELFAGFQDDPDATVAWMLQCLEAGDIVEQQSPDYNW